MSRNLPAFDVVAEEYRDRLKWLARFYIGRLPRVRIDASDIVQEVMLKAYKSYGQFKGEPGPQLFAWLRRILENVIHDEMRKRKHDPALLQSLIQVLDLSTRYLDSMMAGNDTPPPDKVDHADLLMRLAKAMSELPGAERTALELRFLQDPPCSLAEIAEKVGRTRKAAAGLLFRALKRMRKLLRSSQSSGHVGSACL